MEQKSVLVVTPKAPLAGTLRMLLDGLGHRHSVVPNLNAIEYLQDNGLPDVLLIDVDVYELLPDSILRKICLDLNHPPMMVLGNDDLFNRVVARDIRVDDYLSQPLREAELEVRLAKALFERNDLIRNTDQEIVCAHFGCWSFDPGRFELRSNQGNVVRLTSAEARVLLVLLKAPRRAIPRDALRSDESWNSEEAYARSVDILVSRIRKKIEPDAALITTVYGVGYMFDCDVAWRRRVGV